MIRHPDSNLQIAEKIELALSSQNKRVNTEGTNIVTNEFNREDYVINKAQTALSLQGLQESKQNILTAGDGISINNNVISATGGSTSKKLTFSNSGNGAASGSTFDGSAARILSWNSIGAAGMGFSTSAKYWGSDIYTLGPVTLPNSWTGFFCHASYCEYKQDSSGSWVTIKVQNTDFVKKGESSRFIANYSDAGYAFSFWIRGNEIFFIRKDWWSTSSPLNYVLFIFF